MEKKGTPKEFKKTMPSCTFTELSRQFDIISPYFVEDTFTPVDIVIENDNIVSMDFGW